MAKRKARSRRRESPARGLALASLFVSGILAGLVWVTDQGGTQDVRAQDTQAEALPSGGLVDAFSLEVRKIVAKVRPAVVTVNTRRKRSRRSTYHDWFPWGDRPGGEVLQSSGSGVIVSSKGYILTNNHVIEDADGISVVLGDRREFRAQLVGADPKTDIAVLQVKESDLPVAPMGDSDQVQVGDFVLAVGSAFRLSQTVTSGIVSMVSRHLDPRQLGLPQDAYSSFIQTDAAINPGNSGGPLINGRGEVIGINTLILTGGMARQSAGVGFAVPINLVRSVMESLIKHGKVIRGHLGVHIQPLDQDLAELLKIPEGQQGALVIEVDGGTAADRAGLKMDDVIVAFDGREVDSPSQLKSLVGSTDVGKKVKVEFYRDGKLKSVFLSLGSTEERGEAEAQAGKEEGPKDAEALLGLELENLTPELSQRWGLDREQGVVVRNVLPDSSARRKGVEPGDILIELEDKAVSGIEDVRRALKGKKKGDKVKVRLQKGRMSVLFALTLGE